MTKNPFPLLPTVRAHLAARYHAELGCPLREGGLPAPGDPTWHLAPGGAAGVLLDAELGLAAWFVPYVAGSDVAATIQAALHWQPDPHTPLPADEFGPWQVVIHWLVAAADQAAWATGMSALGSQPALAPRVACDAIGYAHGELEAALAEHGLPRLWFTARQVLAHPSPDEAARWLSADRAVLRELEDFPATFTVPEQRRRAELIQDQLGDVVLTQRTENPAPPRELHRFEACHFRNLGHLHLHFGLAPVSCRVVHGPNGTGKTSLFEALALALSGASSRYCRFLSREEKDVTGSDRRRQYTERYLAPLEEDAPAPLVGLNAAAPAPLPLAENWETASRAEADFNGNLLAQETSVEFLGLSAEALALRVLTGYSEFAEQLDGFVEQRVEAAAQRRQAFLRGLGLSTSITRIDSALAGISARTLASELPPPPAGLLAWLDRVAEVPTLAAAASALRDDWRAATEITTLANLAERVAAGPEGEATDLLAAWLTQLHERTRRTQALVAQVEHHLAPWRERHEDAGRELAAWSQWLQHAPGPTIAATGHETEALRRRLAEVQAGQQKALQAGQASRQLLDHLDQVTALLAKGLGASQPAFCPTCGADHAAAGGATAAVAHWRAHVAAQRATLLNEYRALETQAKTLQQSLQARGATVCPLSAAARAGWQSALAWLLGDGELEARLRLPGASDRLLVQLRDLAASPSLPEAPDPAATAQRLVCSLAAQFTEARESFFDQEHWKPVQTALRQKLTRVVTEHLPATLQRLWLELTLNLTAAPWLLPARPRFAISLKRGQRQASVRLGADGPLARYVLNHAETHALGLGWFFTRYLLHGRFRGQFLILDDPAQHLDDAGFHDLCRVWRSLMRLHAGRGLPLRLVIFLHDEARSRAAAQATHGSLVSLGWTREQRDPLREVALSEAPGREAASG